MLINQIKQYNLCTLNCVILSIILYIKLHIKIYIQVNFFILKLIKNCSGGLIWLE